MSPMKDEIEVIGDEVERCPTCDTELEVDDEGGAYCPSETCPKFMIDIDVDEADLMSDLDSNEDEDIYGDS